MDLRDTYRRLYDYEATREVEDNETRSRLNTLYDRFVGAYGHLNARKNAELLRMDTGSSDIFFLMIEWLTWQDLSRQHGAALNRTLGITARNVLLYAFLLIYVLVL